MKIEELSKKLTEYTFSPESGRSAWHCYAYPIIYQTIFLGEPWSINYPEIDTSIASYSSEHVVKWFFLLKDNDLSNDMAERYLNNPGLLDELRQYFNRLRNKISGTLAGLEVSDLSNSELGQAYSNFFDLYQQYFKGTMTLRTLDRGIILKVEQLFGKEQSDNIIRTVSITDEPSFSALEETSLLQLCIKINKNKLSFESPEFKIAIDNIVRTFAWAGLGYYKEVAGTEAGYKKRITEMMEKNPSRRLEEMNARFIADRSARQKLIEHFSKPQKILSEIAAKAAAAKDFVKACINESQYRFEKVFDEISKRCDKKTVFLKDLDVKEIKMLLEGKPIDMALVKRRVAENYLIAVDGKFHVVTGDDARYITMHNLRLGSERPTFEWKGRIASIGHARGRAVIVLGPQDFPKFKKGDILVVLNTSPDFVPIIRDAAAIVSEEGGLTAHVSVVSREFGIPCIVGINNATSIFHDGDEIEADANHGIVKIIK